MKHSGKAPNGRTIVHTFIFLILCLFFMSMPWKVTHGTGIEGDEERGGTTNIPGPVSCIDWIAGNQMVIGDTAYLKTRGTLYYNNKGQRTGPLGRFEVGTCVRIIADAEYRIVAMYEVVEGNKNGKNGSTPSSESRMSTVREDGELRLENGVWKN